MSGVTKGFIQNERGILKPGVEVSIRPFVGRFAHRQAALFEFREVRLGPFEFFDLGGAVPGGRDWGLTQTFPSVLRVRAAGPQRVQRIDDERKPLKIDLNFSIASAAVSSSTAATARIGSPW